MGVGGSGVLGRCFECTQVCASGWTRSVWRPAEWCVSMATLEDVFIEVVQDAIADADRAGRRGGGGEGGRAGAHAAGVL
jgi:hypothetical protein